ncbi:MAG: DNA translocase FtsK 4TM domain-containing protein [bacterium]|nr:DNA translocase FtsK 4TM domain-containing protein [bacterium]
MKEEKKIPEFKIIHEVAGIVILGLALLILVCLIVSEYAGGVGSWIAESLQNALGVGAYLLPVILGMLGFRRFKGEITGSFIRGLGGLLLLISTSVFGALLHEIWIDIDGGGVGIAIGNWLNQGFGSGAWVINLTFFALGFILFTESSLIPRINFFKKVILSPLKLFSFMVEKVAPEEDDVEIEESPRKKRIRKEEPPATPRIILPSNTIPNNHLKEHALKDEIMAHPYQLPSLSLLNDSLPASEKDLKEDLLLISKLLEETLGDFGIEAKVVQVNRGPVVTSFEVQPAAGTKVSSIVNLSDDIALSLAAPTIRIEAPIPGKQVIGVEVPNRKATPVCIKEVLSSDAFINSPSPLSIALGKDIFGKPIITDLIEMPHLLIAGATGSGKSVCINTVITSMLYKVSPYEVKFVMIDPKRVELTIYNGIPHLLFPVIVNAKEAIKVLSWLEREMESRYEKLAQVGARDIENYNKKMKLNQEQGKPLYYIITIIDELADLMTGPSQKNCEASITRLSQMARAIGIHLVLATQRPSVDIITGVIKANFPSRIAFQVFSKVDSRTILDGIGADKLLGKGDMLFLPAGAPKPTRIQGSYVTNTEVEKTVDFIKNLQIHIPSEQIDFKKEIEIEDEDTDDGDDELYNEALQIVTRAGYASTSMIQRRLKIGYNRAARLVEMMEQDGYVGPADGSKPRQVYISPEDLKE